MPGAVIDSVLGVSTREGEGGGEGDDTYPEEAVRDARLDEEHEDALRAGHALDVVEVLPRAQPVLPANANARIFYVAVAVFNVSMGLRRRGGRVPGFVADEERGGAVREERDGDGADAEEVALEERAARGDPVGCPAERVVDQAARARDRCV